MDVDRAMALLDALHAVVEAWAAARDMLPKQPEPHKVYDRRDMCLDCRREEEER